MFIKKVWQKTSEHSSKIDVTVFVLPQTTTAIACHGNYQKKVETHKRNKKKNNNKTHCTNIPIHTETEQSFWNLARIPIKVVNTPHTYVPNKSFFVWYARRNAT